MPKLREASGSSDWLTQARDGHCFTEDLQPPDCLHAAFVRSPHAHARILAIDLPREPDDGVLAFYTARDLDPAWSPIPCIVPLTNIDGSARADPPRTLLASDHVRHEGEAVAMVVARSARLAREAVARVVVRYRPLPAVTDAQAALESQAPCVRPEAPGNLCFDWELGNRSDTAAGFADAGHVVEAELRNNRIVVAPLETRSAIAVRDTASGRCTLVTPTQGVHWVRDVIARDVLHIDPASLEVITPRVGGSFGVKIFVYPEQVLVLVAAIRLGAPIKWVASRREAFLSDTQGRDHCTRAAMALDTDGRVLALRVHTVANLGAHLSNYAPFNPTLCGAPLLAGCYRIGALHARVQGVMTNTPPVDSYRGAGRPEANYVVERLMDLAAAQLDIDPAELRRRNLVPEDQMPWTTLTGMRIDSGRFAHNMDRALDLAGYRTFDARRQQSERQGLLRGIGMANFLESNGGMALARLMEPGGKPRESARIEFRPDGRIRLDVGTLGSGQGHAAAFANVLAQALDWPVDLIDVHEGDTARLPQSTGTGGSKSLLTGSTAVLAAADDARRKANPSPASPVPLRELVQAAEAARDVAGRHPFDSVATVTMNSGTFGNGCHVCEVEVDPATGSICILRYVSVNDFGTLVSPALVTAQLHGGITQGIGQALRENCRFDADGHLCTAGFSTYDLPQALDLPPLEVHFDGVACDTNRLGIKGCGEAGASAAPPAVINAVQHALGHRKGRVVQMPATAAQVWRLLQEQSA